MKRCSTAINLLVLLVLAWASITADALGVYDLAKFELYKVRFVLDITNSGGTATAIKVKVPLLMTKGLPPYQNLRSFTYAPENSIRLVSSEKNQIAEVTVPRLDKNQRVQYQFEYRFYNTAITYNLERFGGWDPGDEQYLRPEKGIESNSPVIQLLASELTKQCGTNLEKAKQIYAYVNSTISYTLNSPEPHSALMTLQRKQGLCIDYALAYIALCRSVGIPSRFVAGYRFDDTDVGFFETDLEQYGHAWAESYLSGLGWVPVDPTSFVYQQGKQVTSFDYFGKISAKDRHLFAHYDQAEELHSAYSYQQVLPKLSIKLKRTVQRL